MDAKGILLVVVICSICILHHCDGLGMLFRDAGTQLYHVGIVTIHTRLVVVVVIVVVCG